MLSRVNSRSVLFETHMSLSAHALDSSPTPRTSRKRKFSSSSSTSAGISGVAATLEELNDMAELMRYYPLEMHVTIFLNQANQLCFGVYALVGSRHVASEQGQRINLGPAEPIVIPQDFVVSLRHHLCANLVRRAPWLDDAMVEDFESTLRSTLQPMHMHGPVGNSLAVRMQMEIYMYTAMGFTTEEPGDFCVCCSAHTTRLFLEPMLISAQAKYRKQYLVPFLSAKFAIATSRDDATAAVHRTFFGNVFFDRNMIVQIGAFLGLY